MIDVFWEVGVDVVVDGMIVMFVFGILYGGFVVGCSLLRLSIFVFGKDDLVVGVM